jgi:hypothetical protein
MACSTHTQGDGTATESYWWQSWLQQVQDFLSSQTLKVRKKAFLFRPAGHFNFYTGKMITFPRQARYNQSIGKIHQKRPPPFFFWQSLRKLAVDAGVPDLTLQAVRETNTAPIKLSTERAR